MNKYFKFILLILIAITLSSCREKKSIQTMSVPISENGTKEFLTCPYTGEYCSEKNYTLLPYMVIIENSRDARPQSGLNDADIIYETMAEGGIPRFIAIYQKNLAPKIGPIRSLRPYFTDLSKEYNLPFAHCGGSVEALNMVDKENLMSMNEMKYGPYFFRDNSRKAPHNLYTSSEKLLELINNNKYSYKPKTTINFNPNYWNNLNANTAFNVSLKLNKFYSTSYYFKDGQYFKSMDNVFSVDKESLNPIITKNIIIQITNIKLQKDNLHINIDLVGEGTGYVISRGKYIKMKWLKKDIDSPTILLDEQNNPLSLSPGKTWWHIVDQNTSISIN